MDHPQRLQRLPVRYFDRQPSGDLMPRVRKDITAVERIPLSAREPCVILQDGDVALHLPGTRN